MFAIPKCFNTYMNILYNVSVRHNFYYVILLLRATCFDPYWVIFRPF